MITLALLGRTTTSSAGTAWMPASSSCVDGLSVGPPSSTWAPSDSYSRAIPGPETTASTPVRAAREWPLRQAGLALGDLRAHVGHVQARDLAGAGEDRDRRLRVVGVDVDLQRVRVADDEHRVAELLQRADSGAGVELARR